MKQSKEDALFIEKIRHILKDAYPDLSFNVIPLPDRGFKVELEALNGISGGTVGHYDLPEDITSDDAFDEIVDCLGADIEFMLQDNEPQST